MYKRDVIFMRRANQYCLIKDGKCFIINVHIGKSKISLVSANQAKKIITSSSMFVLLLLRQNQQEGESVKVKAPLEGRTKQQKHPLEKKL